MALTAPPKEKIKLFQNIDVHGNYVGVLRPEEEDESDIEIPESAEKQQSMENVTARVARVGPEAEHVNPGDRVMVSLYMQQPHQVAKEEDEDGDEYHMFIIDSDMIVATVHSQKESMDEVFN